MVGGEGGCVVGRGDSVGGRVVFAFFLSWLTCKGVGVLLFFALLGGICLYPITSLSDITGLKK